mmetsp:Transcript_47067/g.102420  ORF Transcript_47067/g.102420 Transcript_47067/m.102420 type:complete len:169 (-) Transcript_47067:286-792(-)|eukprot:CAMPEP_0170631618 /NCGR_PEP_ID=MMETSP0224-20130122/34756_1 /TAXON_ID=285029 /ORGANISM="Togula jolla, Strain CCCM 725" /LENGTH=168 /DNA_ID=CAMNT_0010960007 /DNA_START=15 /DNA_END=521 /DNA_ORIENTATION=+
MTGGRTMDTEVSDAKLKLSPTRLAQRDAEQGKVSALARSLQDQKRQQRALQARRRTTKLTFCMYHLQGVCPLQGDRCDYAHSLEEMHQAGALQQQKAKPPREESMAQQRPQQPKLSDVADRKHVTASPNWLPLGEPIFLKPSVSLHGVRTHPDCQDFLTPFTSLGRQL